MSDDHKIGPTAHYTAYAWSRLGLPHARAFATPLGAALFWGFRLTAEVPAAWLPGLPTLEQYLAMRHLTIDAALDAARPDLLVELGAGLSRRGVSWALDRGVEVVEVDLPAMVEAKRRAVARMPAHERAGLAGLWQQEARSVLDPSFAPWLRERLAHARRPAVVAEGLLSYFDLPARESLARAVAGALPPRHGVFLSDLRAADEGGPVAAIGVRVLKAGITLATRGRGARPDFASRRAARDFLLAAGFSDARPLPPPASLAHLLNPARIWRATV